MDIFDRSAGRFSGPGFADSFKDSAPLVDVTDLGEAWTFESLPPANLTTLTHRCNTEFFANAFH